MKRGPVVVRSLANATRWLIPVIVLLVVWLPSPGSVWAQSGTDSTGTGGKHVIQGRIHYPSGQRVDTATLVHLEGSNTGGLSVMCDTNGFFSFTSLAPGGYTVVVDGGDNYETARESVYIDQDLQGPPGVVIPSFTRPYTVDVDLRPKRTVVQPNKTGVVDASLAAIPEASRKLYEAGLESVHGGKHDAAVEQFLGAIALYSEFPQALNELGVQYLYLNQPDKAVRSLRSAVKLAPDAFAPRLNLGKALFKNNNTVEAEVELRAALKKSDTDWSAHFFLGLVYINLKRFDEAEKDFRRALELGGKDLSLPHYYLGGIYWHAGDHKRAADELEQYLKLEPKAQDAEQIRKTIKELRNGNG